MQYALVTGQRRAPFAGGRGVCPQCGSATLAKCGPRVLHHWAHWRSQNCDPWWENETPWHREWKSRFPEDCREVSRIAPDGEIHRADVLTPTGIVIEFQHSTMTDAERRSREVFYDNLVWVIDGRSFRERFDIYHLLPDPTSPIAKDLIWSKASRRMQGAARGLFFRRSDGTGAGPMAGRIYGISDIEEAVTLAYRGHHQYDWVRPHQAWLEASCPVYIDFGDENLVRLEVYDESELRCIRYVSKRGFVNDVMTETEARGVGSRNGRMPVLANDSRRPEDLGGEPIS